MGLGFSAADSKYSYDFIDIILSESLVMRANQGPFPMEATDTWSPTAAGGTHMTLRNRGEPAGFSKVLALFVVQAMRRANRKDLATLEANMEGR